MQIASISGHNLFIECCCIDVFSVTADDYDDESETHNCNGYNKDFY